MSRTTITLSGDVVGKNVDVTVDVDGGNSPAVIIEGTAALIVSLGFGDDIGGFLDNIKRRAEELAESRDYAVTYN